MRTKSFQDFSLDDLRREDYKLPEQAANELEELHTAIENLLDTLREYANGLNDGGIKAQKSLENWDY